MMQVRECFKKNTKIVDIQYSHVNLQSSLYKYPCKWKAQTLHIINMVISATQLLAVTTEDPPKHLVEGSDIQ